MTVTKFPSRIDREVERLFSDNPPVRGDLFRNPVTEEEYYLGLDPVEEQKDAARRALLAREWFRTNAPADAQPLPVSYVERHNIHLRDDYERFLFHYILSLFSRSMEGQKFDFHKHPPFAKFVSGVLWGAEHDGGHLPNCPEELAQLRKRFPPRRLPGLLPSFCWATAQEYAEEMENVRRRRLPPEEYAKAIARLRRSRGLAA
jgi:hypothetical protein